ncbi:unnamed protein product [Brassica oleracea var. botrytis]
MLIVLRYVECCSCSVGCFKKHKDIPCVKPSSTEEKPDGRIDCSVAYGLCHDAFSVSHRVCRAEPQLFGDIRKGDMLYHTTLLHGFCREGRLEEELSVDFVDKGE